jgi:hypothetical protein
MRLRAVLIVLVAILAYRASATEPVSRDRIAILPAAAGPALLSQCSRETISQPDSFWVPTGSDVASIESALPAFLSRPGVRSPRAPLSAYYRQYVGVVAHGKRLVYVSFFDGSSMKDSDTRWRKEAVNVCDGGDHYWGIVFDVDSRSFEPPRFNGEA